MKLELHHINLSTRDVTATRTKTLEKLRKGQKIKVELQGCDGHQRPDMCVDNVKATSGRYDDDESGVIFVASDCQPDVHSC